MSPLLFRNVRLVDPAAGLDQPGDLLVVDRHVEASGAALAPPPGATIIEGAGRILAPGLVDAGVFRADIEACIAGGITSALLMPDQSPPLDDPALIERAERLGKPRLWVRPLAAATQGLRGRELAEIGLMREAGAVAVATGRTAIADSGIMLRLLRYAAGQGLVVVSHAEDAAMTAGAVATEGAYATRLGLAAAPAAAEAVQIARDLRLAREAGARLHFAAISTAEGVALVRAAKAAGQDATAAVTPEAFLLNETALAGYRSFARLSPPLREEADRIGVRGGIADGTIDMICSRHDPRTVEDKRQPFADAAPGAAGAALLLPLSLTLVHDGLLSMLRLLQLLAWHPARRFGLAGGSLAPGAPADLVLIAPDAPWRIAADRMPGLSGNTPFDGQPVQGRVDMLLKGGERL